MKIIIVTLIAALILVTVRILKIGLKRLSYHYTRFRLSDNILVLSEMSIWLAFFFWAVHFLFNDKTFYPYLIIALLFIVVVFTSWFILKDLFAGVFFRLKHNLKSGAFIKTGSISGQIKSQNLTHLKIINSDGQTLRVPYFEVINKIIAEQDYPGTLEEHILHLIVKTSYGNISKVENLIRNAILNSPWSSFKEEPSIKFIKEDDQGYRFEITLLSINMKHMKNIEMAIGEIPGFHIV